jgi:hypothetical protein
MNYLIILGLVLLAAVGCMGLWWLEKNLDDDDYYP